MINDLFHWLLATFLFTPLQAEIDQKIAAAQAPRAVAEQVQTCFQSAKPKLAERASSDWFWGITTVIMVGIGQTNAEQMLADEVPECRPAIDSIRPLIRA